MPVTNGIGRGSQTAAKEDGFAKYMRLHSTIVKSVWANGMSKWGRIPGPYYYIDTHCGDGDNGDGVLGSPVIFLETMSLQRMDYRAIFIDRVGVNISALAERVGDDPRVSLCCGDNRRVIDEVLRSVPGKALGMLYMDPNGEPDVSLLERVAARLTKLDIMVRVSATAIKRNRCAGNHHWRLADIPEKVLKESWQIREYDPSDKAQWTFLIGSNYKTRDWKREGFHHIGTPEGRRLMLKGDCTREELDAINRPQLAMYESVEERSGGVCERCGLAPATDPHHLRYGPDPDPEKILHVCHPCHCELEGKEQ